MSFNQLLERSMFSSAQLTLVCNANFSLNGVTWNVKKGRLNVGFDSSVGPRWVLPTHAFIKHNRMAVDFGEVNIDFEAKNLLSLEGIPRRIDGALILDSDFLRDLKHCTPEVTGRVSISGKNLTSLAGITRKSSQISIKSDTLLTTEGLEGIETNCLDIETPATLKVVTGLKGMSLERLYLRGDSDMVIEDYPAFCREMTIAPYRGMSKLMMAEGVELVGLHGTGGLLSYQYEGLRTGLQEVVLEPSPKKRRLLLEQIMVDLDIEDYI